MEGTVCSPRFRSTTCVLSVFVSIEFLLTFLIPQAASWATVEAIKNAVPRGQNPAIVKVEVQ